MARLTERTENGKAHIIGVDSEGWELILKYNESLRINAAISELATFEEAQEAGKLFFLEYIPGDTVYIANDDKVVEMEIFNIYLSNKCQILYLARLPGNEDTTFIMDAGYIYGSIEEAEKHLGEVTFESMEAMEVKIKSSI